MTDGEEQFLNQLRMVFKPLVLFLRNIEQQLLGFVALLVEQRIREQQHHRLAEQQQGGTGLQLCQGQGRQALPPVRVNCLQVRGNGGAKPTAFHLPHQAAHIERTLCQAMAEIHLDKEMGNRVEEVGLKCGRLSKIVPQQAMEHRVKPIQRVVFDLRPLGPGFVQNGERLLIPGAAVFRRAEK